VTVLPDFDAATMTALEVHETRAHAIPSRQVRDLGDSVALFDPRDPDPFWNRLAAVRWPDDPSAFDRRLDEALTMFAIMGRRAHVWPSPVHAGPVDLADRLLANGFRDIGGGHLMVLEHPEASPPVRPAELGPGVSLLAIARYADAGPGDLVDIGDVLAASFGAPFGRGPELAADLALTLDDPRVVLSLVRVDGMAAAVAKATTFDGLTYLSSIGTLAAFRGRGLAGLATRHVLAAAGAGRRRRTYLGVFSENTPALRLYRGLGFASVGESPDLLLG
jgi:ribosomal protein S18 acetylase RimI-like enzyme